MDLVILIIACAICFVIGYTIGTPDGLDMPKRKELEPKLKFTDEKDRANKNPVLFDE